MAGGLKARFRFPSLGQKSSPKDDPPAAINPPKEYLCPISGGLMYDPVILPTGETFERVCIQACFDLGIEPPSSHLSAAASSGRLSLSAALVPNLALRDSILSWCSTHSHPLPSPLDPAAALNLVRPLSAQIDIPSSSTTGSFGSYPSTSTTVSEETNLTEPHPPFNDRLVDSALEALILTKLKSGEPSEQENALRLLREETKVNKKQRSSLCTAALLAALRPMLLSRDCSLQSNAIASVVNLSLDPLNKTPIVRSGAIPPLVSALKSADPEPRSHAAAALFSLSVDEENKAAVGALGAIPPLLALVSQPNGDDDRHTRRDALLALYHLTLDCHANRDKLAKLQSAGTLVRIVDAGDPAALWALMLMGNLAGSTDGRGALMDAGVVKAAVGVLRDLVDDAGNFWSIVEHCVILLYRLSKGSLRFKALAGPVGAEELLAKLAEEPGDGQENGERVRAMARKSLMVIRGEASGGERRPFDDYSSGEWSDLTSASSFPRWSGTTAAGDRRYESAKSTEF